MADQISNQFEYGDTSKLCFATIQKLDNALNGLNDPNFYDNPSNLSKRKSFIKIRDEIKCLRDIFQSCNPYDDNCIEKLCASLAKSVTGEKKWSSIDKAVSVDMVCEMFPYYKGRDNVRGYLVTRCTHPTAAPLIYYKWLAAHGRWPNNDELPLYFCKQLYADIYLEWSVDYTSIPKNAGQGRRRFHPYKRELVGQNLLIVPNLEQLAKPILTLSRHNIFQSITTITDEINHLTSDQVSNHINLPLFEPTLTSEDPFTHANILSPHHVARMTGEDNLRSLCTKLCSDLLESYQFISKFKGIRLNEVSRHIKSNIDGQRGHGEATSQCPGGDRNVSVGSAARPQQFSNQVDRQRGHAGQATVQCSGGDRNVSVYSPIIFFSEGDRNVSGLPSLSALSLPSLSTLSLPSVAGREAALLPETGLEDANNVATDQIGMTGDMRDTGFEDLMLQLQLSIPAHGSAQSHVPHPVHHTGGCQGFAHDSPNDGSTASQGSRHDHSSPEQNQQAI